MSADQFNIIDRDSRTAADTPHWGDKRANSALNGAGEGNRTLVFSWKAAALPLSYTRDFNDLRYFLKAVSPHYCAATRIAIP